MIKGKKGLLQSAMPIPMRAVSLSPSQVSTWVLLRFAEEEDALVRKR